jgi:hypothetical protein
MSVVVLGAKRLTGSIDETLRAQGRGSSRVRVRVAADRPAPQQPREHGRPRRSGEDPGTAPQSRRRYERRDSDPKRVGNADVSHRGSPARTTGPTRVRRASSNLSERTPLPPPSIPAGDSRNDRRGTACGASGALRRRPWQVTGAPRLTCSARARSIRTPDLSRLRRVHDPSGPRARCRAERNPRVTRETAPIASGRISPYEWIRRRIAKVAAPAPAASPAPIPPASCHPPRP